MAHVFIYLWEHSGKFVYEDSRIFFYVCISTVYHEPVNKMR